MKTWNAEAILEMARAYQPAAVLVAAADLNLFEHLASGPKTAGELAAKMNCDIRGLRMLLDALAALELLGKNNDSYQNAPGVTEALAGHNATSLAMAQHQGSCMRRWAQLAVTVKTGRPPQRIPGVRGEAGDQQSFIGAMHNVSAPMADDVIRSIQPLSFQHLLDVGGGPGTWTMAFLKACPTGRATLFDLPEVIPLAQKRFETTEFRNRVQFVPGDFYTDALPAGADLIWISAIVHQNSREQNRALFAKAMQALAPGGRLAIRDIVMEENRVNPVAGALFAINMLTATEGGGTFTFEELRQDLAAAGFTQITLARQDSAMNSIIIARP